MPRTLATLLATAVVTLAVGTAHAQDDAPEETATPPVPEKIDMAAVTCADLAEEGDQGVTMMLFWVDGYLSATSGDTILDPHQLGLLAEQIGARCAADPTQKVLEIVGEIVDGDEE